MKLKVFTKLPTTPLLFATSCTVMRQVRVGIVVKESGHGRRTNVLLFQVELNVESQDVDFRLIDWDDGSSS